MKDELEAELRQLARTTTYAHRLSGFQQWTTLLLESADEEAMRLERVRARLVQVAEVIPLTSALLTAAAQYQRQYGLSPQDALVYAAVLAHLKQSSAPESCFLNKNSKDFDDPDVVEELSTYNCKLMPRFDTGYQFILSRLA